MAELSTVELAQKQRHLNLLMKIKEGETLKAGELKELQSYEEQMAKTKKTKRQVKKKRKKPDKKKLTTAKIKQIALDAEDLVHTKAEYPDLAKLLKKKSA